MIGYPYTEDDFRMARGRMRPYAQLTWFGMDASRQVAMFISAGLGPIPLKALDDFQRHKRIYSEFLLFEHDDRRDIGDVARGIGCFVYDWDAPQSWYSIDVPYTRMRQPACPLVLNRAEDREVLSDIVIDFDLDFSTKGKILQHEIPGELNV